MIHRSADSNGFEFVRVASLRAAQLMRGCSPRVAPSHKSILTAQMEVVAGKVSADVRLNGAPALAPNDPRKHVSDNYVRVNNR
jgi:DNA-directed RNA polymerase subunit K/omega